MEHTISWVFSGIGVAVLGWVVTWIYGKCKKRAAISSKNKAHIKGDNNISIQGSNKSTIRIEKK